MNRLPHQLLVWILVIPFLAILGVASLAQAPPVAAADTGWSIKSLHADINIDRDGALNVTERMQVDFHDLEKHGIYRDIPVVYDYNQDQNRVYDLKVLSVADNKGVPIPYKVSQDGSMLEIKIGDPDITVSGLQSYEIKYRVQHALNGFSDHDELYWNVNGEWPVPSEAVTATVVLPAAGIQKVACYEGPKGSTETCRSSVKGATATFVAAKALGPSEQMTVVVGFPKGLVAEPTPKLEAKPRPLADYFERTTTTIIGAIVTFFATLIGLVLIWWRRGRDRRYSSIYYLTDNPQETTRPLLSRDPIVIEYQPPEKLLPAQMGLLLDERADTLDATATIVDLAVRGYLKISEIQPSGAIGHLFGHKDWELTRLDKDSGDLLDFEKILYNGLFTKGSPIKLSDLKNTFHSHLARAQTSLYKDSAKRHWFATRPDQARTRWGLTGFGIAVLGAAIAYGLGHFLGAAIVGIPFIIGGVVLMAMSGVMPKRTALGSEMLRRTLGFRQYVATAETSRQEFNEQRNIFAAYLPYAIVFHCVDKWARAFRDIDIQTSTAAWYVGTTGFYANSFSRDLSSFSSQVSSTIVSTPGGSGSSGFSGSSGGGGGGGGGGSW